MPYRLKGMLKTPDGKPLSGVDLQFIAQETKTPVLQQTDYNTQLGVDGSYDVTLEDNTYAVKARIGGLGPQHMGYILITKDTAAGLDLPQLLSAYSPAPPTPEYIQQIEEWLAEASEYAKRSEQYAADANESKISAAASASIAASATWDSAAIAIVQASGGKVEMIKDALGNSHLFGVWPIQTYEQLQIPNCPFTGVIDVFRRQDGTFRSECRIAIHKSANVGGSAVSRSGLAPYVNLNLDEFRSKASELSGGFRMLDIYHNAFINWQILSIIAKGGQQPKGNTEWGRAHSMISEVGRRVDGRVSNDRVGAGVTLTGSGPSSWRHDGTTFGVSDWVGNVWEWVDGLKMLNGQFYIAQHSGQPEAQWVATGRYINSGSVFSMTAPISPVASTERWGSFGKTSGYIGHELLQRLMIEPIDCTKVLDGNFSYNTEGERPMIARAGWGNGATAGPAALTMQQARSYRGSNLGARLAFSS